MSPHSTRCSFPTIEMQNNTNILITGANRGIGRGLVEIYLSRPSSTVIAAVRDPSHPTSQSLSELPTGDKSRLIVVKIDAIERYDAFNVVKDLQATYNITHLDVVIANAGVSNNYGPVVLFNRLKMQEMVDVNVFGPLSLCEATLELMKKAERPRFVVCSSRMGCIGELMDKSPYPTGAYGATKAMVNFLVRKIHFENEELVAFPVYPGFPNTDLGMEGARALGLKGGRHTVEESANMVIKVVDGATREKTSGKFINGEDGSVIPW